MGPATPGHSISSSKSSQGKQGQAGQVGQAVKGEVARVDT